MELTVSPYKSFRKDIEVLASKLENHENFSFSKYADGEWAVIKNHPINNKEFWFNPDDNNDQYKRMSLIKSFQFKHPNYYVGISCPCCQGIDTFNEMMRMSGQNDDHLTWANLWVNGNYSYYVNHIIPIYRSKPIVLFCNSNSKIENLPFFPKQTFFVSYNAWANDWGVIEETKNYISYNSIEDHIFLFCCGPFGNILCHQLTEFNDKNTYLDIGSTLNPLLKSAGFERHYYMGNNIYSQLICQWGK